MDITVAGISDIVISGDLEFERETSLPTTCAFLIRDLADFSPRISSRPPGSPIVIDSTANSRFGLGDILPPGQRALLVLCCGDGLGARALGFLV